MFLFESWSDVKQQPFDLITGKSLFRGNEVFVGARRANLSRQAGCVFCVLRLGP